MKHLLPILLLGSTSISAQVGYQTGLDISYYVNDILLAGEGQASNIAYSGSMSQIGTFSNAGGVLGLEEGLVMSTDAMLNAFCMSEFCSDCLGYNLGDADLLEVANSVPPLIGQSFTVSSVNDLAILEFDFVATSSFLSMEFLFGSDEYSTFVNTQYNDVFVIFLSGPGIEGPYSSPTNFPGGAVNLAIVPGSLPPLPVTISSVNSGMNSNWYLDNADQLGVCLNGFTLPMEAQYSLILGETYHLKLAIADGTDTALESVFMCQSGILSDYEPIVDIELGSDVGEQSETEVFESCGTLELTISRAAFVDPSESMVIALNFPAGDATNGVDFGVYDDWGVLQPLPSEVVLPPFEETISFEISAPSDAEEEGSEYSLIQIEVETSSTGLFDAFEVDFSISDAPDPIEVVPGTYTPCPGEVITLEPQISGGFGQYNFQWCSGETTSTLTSSWTEDWSCELMIDDTCGASLTYALVEVDVFDSEQLELELSTDSPLELGCFDAIELTATPSGGLPPYTLNWWSYNIDLISDGAWALASNPTGPSYVAVGGVDGCGQNFPVDTLEFGLTSDPLDIILPDTIWGHCGLEVFLEAYPEDAPEEWGGVWLQNNWYVGTGTSFLYNFQNQSDLVFQGFDGCGGSIVHTIHVVFDGDICGEFDCEDQTTALVNGENDPWVTACPSEVIFLSGSASSANTTQGVTGYEWLFEGGISNEVEIELALESGLQQVTFVAHSMHDVDGVTCEYADTTVVNLAVSSEPQFNHSLPEPLCADEVFTLIAGAEFTPILEEEPSIATGTWILADDQTQCHNFPLWVNYGAPGMTVDAQMSQEMSVAVVMEHSFMGDLTISLECPDGSTLPLHEMGGSGTFLGEPVDNEQMPNAPGTGYEYIWSPNAENSTWVDEATFSGSLPAGTYAATGDWTALEGCPVNGEWTLSFCDAWGADNGFLFGWGVQFSEDANFIFEGVQNPVPDWACDASGWVGNPAVDNCSEWEFPEGISADTTFVFELHTNYGCTFFDTLAVSLGVPGCMDPEAANYLADANCPTECIYVLSTCDEMAAQDWSSELSGVYPEYRSGFVGVDSSWNWMVNLAATVIDQTSGTEFNTSYLSDLEVTGIPPGVEWTNPVTSVASAGQTCINLVGTPTTEGMYNLTVTGELFVQIFGTDISIGIQSYIVDFEVFENPWGQGGCTYSTAVNFSQEAVVDDGSCLFPGCMDPMASNYSSVFNSEEDGTCIYETDDCPGDLTGDGQVAVGDLLAFLSVFGTECESGSNPNAWECGDPFQYQGYAYATTAIGEACWFAENLRSTAYSNGDEIPAIEDGPVGDWAALPFGTQTIYGEVNCTGDCSVAENLETYGRLYSRRAIQDDRNVCPVGWHVPVPNDWYSLLNSLLPENCINCFGEEFSIMMRSSSIWDCPIVGTNSVGLNVLPAGTFGSWNGGYSAEGTLAIFGTYYDESNGVPWDYTPFWVACTWSDFEGIGNNNAYSVRCIQD